ncbi:putative membrane protein YfcA [Rhizobium ruizarguesonis]|jgi:uncharacterized membrane protein YfcA
METVKYALPMSLQTLQLGAANATRPSEIPARNTTLPDIAFHLLLLLCAAAFFAGFVDSIAGGGGPITVPVMLIAGIPPLQTLGTNKVQSLFGAASATIAYTRKGHVQLAEQLPMALMAVMGGSLGAALATIVPGQVLQAIMPVLLVTIAIFFAVKPNLNDLDTHRRMPPLSSA